MAARPFYMQEPGWGVETEMFAPVQETAFAGNVFPGAALGGVYGGFGLQRAELANDVAWDAGLYGMGAAVPAFGGFNLENGPLANAFAELPVVEPFEVDTLTHPGFGIF